MATIPKINGILTPFKYDQNMLGELWRHVGKVGGMFLTLKLRSYRALLFWR